MTKMSIASFFVFENITARSFQQIEKPLKVLEFLDEKVFELFNDSFDIDGESKKEKMTHLKVKIAFPNKVWTNLKL